MKDLVLTVTCTYKCDICNSGRNLLYTVQYTGPAQLVSGDAETLGFEVSVNSLSKAVPLSGFTRNPVRADRELRVCDSRAGSSRR